MAEWQVPSTLFCSILYRIEMILQEMLHLHGVIHQVSLQQILFHSHNFKKPLVHHLQTRIPLPQFKHLTVPAGRHGKLRIWILLTSRLLVQGQVTYPIFRHQHQVMPQLRAREVSINSDYSNNYSVDKADQPMTSISLDHLVQMNSQLWAE